MLPKPSLCLNIPKTGSSFVRWFFDAADWLELKRTGGLRRLRVPKPVAIHAVKAIKRHALAYGSLNSRLRDHHASYSTWPEGIREHPRLCTLRDTGSWYCSFYLYYTLSMTNTLLSRVIRLVVEGRGREPGADLRAVLLRHRREFLERFGREDAGARSIENVSLEFFVWFTQTVRNEYLLKRWVGIDTFPKPMGFLTFRTITLLFDDPARVLNMQAQAFDKYFASGRYRRDLRCDYYLRFDSLTDELCALMTGEFEYAPDIVEFLRTHADRRNVSPGEAKRRVMIALARDGLLGRIRRDEAVYERFLLPLAGSRPARAPDTGTSVPL